MLDSRSLKLFVQQTSIALVGTKHQVKSYYTSVGQEGEENKSRATEESLCDSPLWFQRLETYRDGSPRFSHQALISSVILSAGIAAALTDQASGLV
ncbi:hypothetical protein RRG08_061063 [Elysia crispata]|uniref:Uncharacterized protein n=1 Tax=Elysia crispata TaxID=231223 RepID=A0AAE1AW46_9GAST|nr:hypothetical protein RRG08_061063 [Elysia crispata]